MVVLLTITSTWVYGYTMKEGNILFNDIINTFYLQLYDVGHVKDIW